MTATALEVRGGPFNGQLLALPDGDKHLEVRVGSLRIHHLRLRDQATAEAYLQFTRAEVVALKGLVVVSRPASPQEIEWAGVPRGN